MLTYITRRTLYSIPVMLDRVVPARSGSCATTFDPLRQAARPRKDVSRGRSRCRERARPRRPGRRRSTADWLGNAVHGDLGDERAAPTTRCRTMIQPALWYTVQLIFWGILVSAIARRSRSASTPRSSSTRSATTSFTGLSFIGIAMPPFWFGLLAIQFLAVGPKTWFHLDEPLFYFVGLHSGGQTGLQPRLRPPPRAAGADADRADHRGVEPVPAGVDARRAVGRLRPHRAGQGRAAAQGDLQARVAQRADPARHRHGARHGALFGGLIITEQIFSIPGMGRLFLDALTAGDATGARWPGSSSPRSSSSSSTCSPTCSTASSIRGSG